MKLEEYLDEVTDYGKEVTDSDESIIQELCVMFNVNPEYLITNIRVNLSKAYSIKANSVVDILNQYYADYDSHDDSELITELIDNNISANTVAELICYNILRDDEDCDVNSLILSFKSIIKDDPNIDINTLNINKKFISVITDKDFLDKFSSEVDGIESKIQERTKTVNVYNTHLNSNIVNVTLVDTIVGHDIDALFDNFTASKLIPFCCTYNSKYKVYKGVSSIDTEWYQTEKDTITFYVKNHSSERDNHELKFNKKHYTKCVIKKVDNVILINVVINVKNEIHKALILKDIDRTFCITNGADDTYFVTSLSADVRFKAYKLNINALLHVITNNEVISDICYVKEMSGVTVNTKVVICLENKTKIVINGIVDNILTVNIHNVINSVFLEQTIKLAGTILKLAEDPKITKLYSKYGCDIDEGVNALITLNNNTLDSDKPRVREPELFPTGYPRLCQKNSSTLIVDAQLSLNSEDIVDMPNILYGKQFVRTTVEQGVTTLKTVTANAYKFPRTNEVYRQHYYACIVHDTLTEFSLKEAKRTSTGSVERSDNKGEDSEIVYLPCCYKQEDVSKKSLVSKYYAGETMTAPKSKVDLMVTLKHAGDRKFGILPPSILELLQSINIESKSNYFYRYGNNCIGDSFIRAVADALFPNVDYTSIKKTIISNITSVINSCRQNAFHLSSNSLVDMLNSTTYIDPRLYYRAIEEYYKVNVVIFAIPNKKHAVPYITDGYFKHSLLKYKPYSQSIIILEYYGSETNVTTIPKCELVINSSSELPKSANPVLKFKFEDVSEIFIELTQYTVESFDRNIIPTGVVSQYIDEYGKTRCLKIRHNKSSLYVTCDPIPPLTLKEHPLKMGVNSRRVLKDYIKSNNYAYTSKDNVYSIDVNGFIYTCDVNPQKISQCALFKLNKKYAFCLLENTLYKFSVYLKDNNIVDNYESILFEFMSDNMVVDPDNTPEAYPITRELDINYPNIVSSNEVLQRLFYNMKIALMSRFNDVINYHSSKYIYNYYVNASDYTKRCETEIFTTRESLDVWLTDIKRDFEIKKQLMSGTNIQFIFLNDEIYRVINTVVIPDNKIEVDFDMGEDTNSRLFDTSSGVITWRVTIVKQRQTTTYTYKANISRL